MLSEDGQRLTLDMKFGKMMKPVSLRAIATRLLESLVLNTYTALLSQNEGRASYFTRFIYESRNALSA